MDWTSVARSVNGFVETDRDACMFRMLHNPWHDEPLVMAGVPCLPYPRGQDLPKQGMIQVKSRAGSHGMAWGTGGEDTADGTGK